MLQEISYGVIPLRKNNGSWEALLIQHKNGGHWAFPKGHPEPGEISLETARRELAEETGLMLVKLLKEETIQESYTFQRKAEWVQKTVVYYLGEVDGDLSLLPEEVCGFEWLPLEEAEQLATFPEAKEICLKVCALMTE